MKKILSILIFSTFAFAQNSTWKEIQTKIFDKSCNSCHNPSSMFGVQSGLILTGDSAYKNMLNVAPKNLVAKNEGLVRVSNMGSFQGIAKSFLWEKIDASQQQHFYDDHPYYGGLMPLGDRFLTNGELKFIYQWIGSGAPDTGVVANLDLLNDTSRYELPKFKVLAPPPAGSGIQFHLGPFNVRPNANNDREFAYYWPLNHAEDIFVNRIEISMRTGSHHFIFYTFNKNILNYPGLVKLIDSLKFKYRDLRDTLTGLVNIYTAYSFGFHDFFQGTQTPYINKGFPKGIALRLPAKTGFDLNSHYVNRSGVNLTGEIYANMYTIPKEEVKAAAEILNLGNQEINLPPNQTTVITKDYTFNENRNIIQLFTHAHERLKEFEIKIVGGVNNGKTVYWTDDWSHPPILEMDPPLTLKSGEGLRAIATYFNPTSQTIRFGLQSTDEMMIVFGAYYLGESLKVENEIAPLNFELLQNYPNPFNPSTTISFVLPKREKVSLKIYNVLGKEISVLADNKIFEIGKHEIKFEADKFTSGIYFYKFSTNGFTDVKKMLLLK